MNSATLLRFPPKLQKARPLLALTRYRTKLTMIGSPDSVVTGQELHTLCSGKPGLSLDLENCRSKPFSCKNGLSIDEKPKLLRETAPEMPDWDFELKAKLLIVEGNIGVGKTTLTKKLADKLLYRIFLEPTTENPYLGMYIAVIPWPKDPRILVSF